MIGRALSLIFGILYAPMVLGNLLVRAVLFPSPRPPALRHAGVERAGRIANVLGVALVVWAAVAGGLSGRESFGNALAGAFLDAVAGLVVIGVLIVCAAILFVVIARRGSRRVAVVRVPIPVGAFSGYLVIVVGSVLLANALIPVGDWVLANVAEGFWRVVLTLLVAAVMFYLMGLFMAALAMGTWHGSRQLFRSADAHPLFPVVVGLGMAAVSAVVLCVVEGVWLLRPPRSVRFREVYAG